MSFALVFPGQGSQALGMLDTWSTHAEVTDTLAEASAVTGINYESLIAAGPESELNATRNTQPVMLAAGVAMWRVWKAMGGPDPALVAGHSLGEYAALVAAGSLDFTDAVALVEQRGRAMQEAVPEGQGAMAAVIGMEAASVGELCSACAQGEVLEPVNFNAPGQIVVAGHSTAVDRLVDGARAAGARLAQRLAVSVPAHSSLMSGVAQQLRDALAPLDVRIGRFTVLHNIDARPRTEPEAIKEALAQQVCTPVQWVRTQEALQAAVKLAGECGPGKVLSGLGKRSAKSISWIALGTGPDAMHALMARIEGSNDDG